MGLNLRLNVKIQFVHVILFVKLFVKELMDSFNPSLSMKIANARSIHTLQANVIFQSLIGL